MSHITEQIAEMVDMLPEQEQTLAFELVRRLVLAWDPDFTKLTPAEAKALDAVRAEYERGESYAADDIDWDNLDKLNLD